MSVRIKVMRVIGGRCGAVITRKSFIIELLRRIEVLDFGG